LLELDPTGGLAGLGVDKSAAETNVRGALRGRV
jgi:hypothetical protein